MNTAYCEYIANQSERSRKYLRDFHYYTGYSDRRPFIYGMINPDNETCYINASLYMLLQLDLLPVIWKHGQGIIKRADQDHSITYIVTTFLAYCNLKVMEKSTW